MINNYILSLLKNHKTTLHQCVLSISDVGLGEKTNIVLVFNSFLFLKHMFYILKKNFVRVQFKVSSKKFNKV